MILFCSKQVPSTSKVHKQVSGFFMVYECCMVLGPIHDFYVLIPSIGFGDRRAYPFCVVYNTVYLLNLCTFNTSHETSLCISLLCQSPFLSETLLHFNLTFGFVILCLDPLLSTPSLVRGVPSLLEPLRLLVFSPLVQTSNHLFSL